MESANVKASTGGIKADFAHAGQLVCEELEQQLNAKVSRDEAKEASAERNDHGLAEQLIDNTRAACAERGANGDLFAARKRAREDQVGNIRTRDQKHKCDCAQHHEQRGANFADCFFAHGVDGRAPSFVVIGIGLLESLRDGVHLCLCYGESDAGLEARYRLKVMFAANGCFFACECKRSPELREVRLGHLGAHHADDRVRLPVKVDGPTEDVGI